MNAEERGRAMKWLILASWWAQGALHWVQRHHLTTDPACVRFVVPRPGSRLDRWSRGLECEPCIVRRALGDHARIGFTGAGAAESSFCKVPPPGWWCSRPSGHEPPCAARPTSEGVGDPDPDGSPDVCTCPSGDGSLRWPCPTHPPTRPVPAREDER